MTLPDVMFAVVVLGAGARVESVTVLGADESLYVTRSGGQTHVDSKHQLFRDVSVQAALAARFYEHRRDVTALEDLLVWLSSYRGIFGDVCTQCGTMLFALQEPQPPVCRDYDTFQPYHKCCLSSVATACMPYVLPPTEIVPQPQPPQPPPQPQPQQQQQQQQQPQQQQAAPAPVAAGTH